MTKKDLQSEKTKRDFLQAAISLFAKKGFHSSSITQIAESAHLSKGALYWHFENKEELLFHTIEEIRQEWKNVLRRELKREWKARQKLDKILDLFVDLTLESKEKYVIFIVLIAEFTEVQERFEGHLRDVFDEFFIFLAQIIDQGKEDGSLQPDLDSHLMAIAFMGSWQGILLQWIFNRNDVQLRNLVEALRFLIFSGLSHPMALPQGEDGKETQPFMEAHSSALGNRASKTAGEATEPVGGWEHSL